MAVTLSPAARSCTRLLASEKVQLTKPWWADAMAPLSAMASARAAPRAGVTVAPPAATGAPLSVTAALARSLASASLKLTEPLLIKELALSSTTDPVTLTGVITGRSLVPLIVMGSNRSALAPELSVTRMVKVRVRLSPSARCWKAAAPELKLQFSVPVLTPALITVIGSTVSMALRAAFALVASPLLTPLTTTLCTTAVTLLLRSSSPISSEPLPVRPASPSTRLRLVAEAIVGKSLLPSTVTVIV